MAYFEYDDRYGCRVSEVAHYVAPPTDEELAAARAAKISAITAENKAIMALTPADVLGCVVRVVDYNAPFTFAQGIQFESPCESSDTGWSVGQTLWACTSESKYDVAEIAMSRKGFFALFEKFEAWAKGKDHKEVIMLTPSPVMDWREEDVICMAGYELFKKEWEEKNPSFSLPQGVVSYMQVRKGERIKSRNKEAERAIRADVHECKEAGSFIATAEWFADLFWDHS